MDDIIISDVEPNVVITTSEPEVIITDEYQTDYNLPIASATTLGVVKIGSNVDIATDGTISVKTASTTEAGVIKVGSGLTISDGVLSATGTSITIDNTLSTTSVNPVQNKVITSNLNTLAGSITSLQGTVSNQGTTIGNHTTAIGNLHSALSDAEGDIDDLQDGVAQQSLDIASNAYNIGVNTNAISSINSTLTTLSGQVGTHTTDIMHLQGDVDVLEHSVFQGRHLSIYGDSISTYAGYIPVGNATYYTGSNAGVSSVDETWWKRVIDALGLVLYVNNSWSGRAVSSIRDSQTGHTTDAGYKQANIDVLGSEGNPDIIIVKLGINDFNQGALLGTYDGSSALPNDPTKFTDAYAMMLDRIMTSYPLAKVYCCTLMQCERTGSAGFPEINSNGESLIQWNEAIRKLAEAFGCEVLDHAKCGITYYNLSYLTGDYDSGTGKGLHPNAAGMSLIADKTIQEMDNAIRIRY